MPNKILCVGLVCVDLVQSCDGYPEEDSDQRSRDCRWQRGGNASNNCTVLSQLGAQTEFFGTISNNGILSKFIKEDFKKYGICIEHCVIENDKELPLSTVIVNLGNGSRTIVHSNKGWTEVTFQDFLKLDLKDYSWIHFEGRNTTEVLKMMKYTNELRLDSSIEVKISVELEKPNLRLLDLAPYADVVFIGKDFALHNNWPDMEQAVDNMKHLVHQSATVICAWGSRGATGVQADCKVTSGSFPPAGRVLDTLGAGDTFCAAVVHLLSRKLNLKQTLETACRLAGAKVGMIGYDGIDAVYKRIENSL